LKGDLKRFGFPENKGFIFLFIATVPVIADTIFKYWIFRYLNRSSPSAVATYHNMNE
jgi:lipoprotein signal peptidase